MDIFEDHLMIPRKGKIFYGKDATYSGYILEKMPYGEGKLLFSNGDQYIGSFMLGKFDGFGTYKYTSINSQFTGFFSFDEFHGIGTYEDPLIICKGTWRNGFKHGYFYKTDKFTNKTIKQLYFSDMIIAWRKVEYIHPDRLQTVKKNPMLSVKKINKKFKGHVKKCIGCYVNSALCAVINCGHVVMCHDCLTKCVKCPMCRGPINEILQLYVN